MITYLEALSLILKSAELPEIESRTPDQALGAVTAVAITSPRDIPSFDNSAMDGFAVNSADCKSADKGHAIILPVGDSIAIGDGQVSLPSGTAGVIVTGAAMPTNADAVIPVEDVTVHHDAASAISFVTVQRPVSPHEHVRFKGQDFKSGAHVLPPRVRITPEHIMALAALGIGTVKTRPMPVVQIIATGNELVEDSKQPLAEGKIYNCNSPYLLAACRSAGIQASYLGRVTDDAAVFKRQLERLLETKAPPRIIVSTGAVSKGGYDFIPSALQELKAEILFHRVAIRPGKPILFARLPQGDYFFGLPGNPVSTAVGFRFFVVPLMRALAGLEEESYETAKLAHGVQAKPGLRHFLKAKRLNTPSGNVVLDILPGQESFKISPLLDANGWAIIDETAKDTEAGATVSFAPFEAFPSSASTMRTEEMQQCQTA